MNRHEQATIIEAQVRSSRANVEIAGALRDLTAEVSALADVVHKMAVLLAEREAQSPASGVGTSDDRPGTSDYGLAPESSPASDPDSRIEAAEQKRAEFLAAVQKAEQSPALHPYPQGYPDHLTADAHDWEPPPAQNQESSQP